MTSEAKTVDEYLTQVPEKRVAALQKIRKLCLEYLPDHEEDMVYKCLPIGGTIKLKSPLLVKSSTFVFII